MPLSLKYLIDDALGEEDFEALIKILSVLAVGRHRHLDCRGLVRALGRAAGCRNLISDIRMRLFEHVQNLPSAFFARTKRGETLSRFSIDLSAVEGAIKTFANSAVLPFLELIAGIVLMLFLNWQLRRGGAADLPDHADRSADPDAQGGAGELRSEDQRGRAARHGAGKRRGTGGREGLQPAAPRARLVRPAQRRGAARGSRGDVPVDHGRAHRDHRGAAAAPRGAGDRRLSRHQGPDHRSAPS